MKEELKERVISRLRWLALSFARRELEYEAARKVLEEGEERRRAQRARLQALPYREAVEELAKLGITQGHPALLARHNATREEWEYKLEELRRGVIRASAEYDGARMLAVDLGLIRLDEHPSIDGDW